MTIETMTIETTALANRFADILRDWLTPGDWKEMRKRNAALPQGICASHDFCDANEAMLEAFQSFGIEPLPEQGEMPESIAAQWGAAWELAKKERLTAHA